MSSSSVCKQTKIRLGCILSCCFSCSFCSFSRASTKERSKSRTLSEQNKACQRCMLCKSLPFCPICSQCPQCCLRTKCRGKTSKILASLANHGFKSSGSLYPQRGLHSTLQTKTHLNQIPSGSKWLRESNQKQVSQRSSSKPHEKVGSGKSGCQVLPGILQLPFPGSQTQRQV